MRGCLILVLAGLGFALGFALAPRHHGGAAPPMNDARAAHEVIVAIPAPTSARVPAALALPVHHRHSATAPSATHSQAPTTAASATTAAAAASVQSVGQTRPATKQTQTTPATQGTTTDPFDGQPHPKTGGSSTDGQPPPP